MNLKFALAAGVCAAALAGFSDVTSANVVGYMGKGTPSTGKTMIAPMFNNVGENGTFKLSDLRGDGYEKEGDEWGAYGELCITVLNSAGSADTFKSGKYAGEKMKFYWWDNEDTEAGWYDIDGEDAWDADSVTFTMGQAFWTEGGEQTLVVAGQVGKDDVTVGTPSTGKRAMGNPFAAAVTLASMFGDGYEKEGDEWGAYGELCVTVLGTSGSADTFKSGKYAGEKMKFYWWDNEDTAAGWYDIDGEDAWDAEAVEFPAGQGLWVEGGTQTLTIPAPNAVKL